VRETDALEGYAMAHREQHSNREAKKPKKEKPKGGMGAQPNRWVVREALERNDDSKHQAQAISQPKRPVRQSVH
jgi:hypothetical protein